MHATNTWPRFEEPLRRTLARNATLAAIVPAVASLLRHDLALFLSFAALALWPTLGGHYVELAFLNGVRPRIPPGRLPQAVTRLLVWFVGGTLLYVCMAITTGALPVMALPLRQWWCGGLGFIGLELVAHSTVALRGVPNFYNGRG